MMILDMFKLDGKVAIVTGASRGLGEGMAIGLAEAGADVACVASSDVSHTVSAIEKLGRRAIAIKADFLDPSCAAGVITQTVEQLGGVDILVNNAGTIRRGGVLEFSEQDWDDVLNVNLKTLFLLSQEAARVMVEQGRGGKMINIASMLSYQGGIRICSYTAAKSGVMGLTRIMGNELAEHNINVNGIAPGYFATDNTLPLQKDPKRNGEILARIPAGRWGAPDDLKGAVVFLASAASDYMQGFTLAVDGGWLSR
jgi:2-dehydro-3-deoxy-D-gluconate 5-dehydrogenase